MYDAKTIAEFYDAYGEKEWERLVLTPRDQVSFHIHKHYLEKSIKAGDKVLEAGAGAGRFTIELAKLGTKITVGDISKVQLELNEKYVKEAGFESCVEARVELDITHLSEFNDNQFDTVVCYGGPISYTLDKADQAISELLRVTKTGGYLLLSVMSLVGTTRAFFEVITKLERYPDIVDEVNRTGILTGETNRGHILKMYRYSEFKTLLSNHPCKLVTASASNCLSLRMDALMEEQMKNARVWERILAWELDYCAEEGTIDSGTHIIAVVQKVDV